MTLSLTGSQRLGWAWVAKRSKSVSASLSQAGNRRTDYIAFKAMNDVEKRRQSQS